MFSAKVFYLFVRMQDIAANLVAPLCRLVRAFKLFEFLGMLFKLKLFFDGLVVAILSKFLPAQVAQAVGVLVSVNTLTGFVAAIYAVIISEAVLRAEDLNG